MSVYNALRIRAMVFLTRPKQTYNKRPETLSNGYNKFRHPQRISDYFDMSRYGCFKLGTSITG